MQVERVDLYKYFGKERKGNQQGYLNVYIAEEPCTFEGQDRKYCYRTLENCSIGQR